MSTVAATRSKTYDIVYIAVFAVIMAICSWISDSGSSSVYIADIWCFYCRRDSRRKKRNTFCSCIYPSRSHRCAGICRIFRWNRCSCRNDRWVYHRISFLCTCNVGNGKTSWQKAVMQIVSMIVGLIVCYAFGTAWFMIVYSRANGAVGLATVLGWCVIPFIIPDIIKIVLAYGLSRKLRKFVA